MTNIAKYEQMRDQGASRQEVYLAARSAGLNGIELIALLCRVFGLSLIEAKEVTVVAQGLADSLSEYQATFIPLLDKLEREGCDSLEAKSDEPKTNGDD